MAGFAAAALTVFGAGLAVGLMFAPASASRDAQQFGPGVPPFAGTPVRAPTARVADGTDPKVGSCEADARLIDRAPVLHGSLQIGALDLFYSPRCGAGWARIYLYPAGWAGMHLNPGQPAAMGEVTVWASDGRYSAFAYPLVKQLDDYTDVIVPGRGGCLAAYGQVYQAGQAVVTASLPCEIPSTSSGHP